MAYQVTHPCGSITPETPGPVVQILSAAFENERTEATGGPELGKPHGNTQASASAAEDDEVVVSWHRGRLPRGRVALRRKAGLRGQREEHRHEVVRQDARTTFSVT